MLKFTSHQQNFLCDCRGVLQGWIPAPVPYALLVGVSQKDGEMFQPLLQQLQNWKMLD